jgi:hypothetical protein
MRIPRLSLRSLTLRAASTTATIALLTAFTATDSLLAQAQIQAFYPLASDLIDASGNYGPMRLLGNSPPAAPNNGVCVNGIYSFAPGGQDVQTPMLPTLTTTDFEIDVDFNITALPTYQAPVIMGGDLWRWLGIYLQANGTVGIKFNNNNFTWSSTTLSTGQWYSAALKFEGGVVVLFINGVLVHYATIGALVDGNNLNLTTNDFSNGLNFNGCIRNLLILNDTTVLATAAPFGAGCVGSAGVPALTPITTPQIGGVFQLDTTNLSPSAAFAFQVIGLNRTTSPLGPLPLNLQPFGLGPNCDLLVNLNVSVLFSVAGGGGSFSLTVPSNTALDGLALYFQSASIDSGAIGGLALSNGVAATIGF